MRTITSIFMVPPLKIPKNELKSNGILNAYIKDEMNNVHYDDCIFLLFHPEFPSRFRKFINREYDRTKAIIDDYDYPNGFVVVVYKLNPHFAADYEYIKQSKYSKTSKEFQNQFSNKVELVVNGETREEVSLQYRIFNRTPDLVKYWMEKHLFSFNENKELWYDFNEKFETLTIEKLKDLFWNKFTDENT